MISIQTRFLGVGEGPDALLRMMLFWAMFLPVGARYSIDAAMATAKGNMEEQAKRVFSPASVALLLQVIYVYWFAVLLKSAPEWRHEGTAVWYAFSLEQLQTPVTRIFLQAPTFLKFLTFFVLAEEALAPVMLLFPVPMVRAVGVLFLAAMQLGFFSTLRVGLFPQLACVALIPFLPGFFWDRGEQRRDKTRITIYYDGGCDFCRKSVHILREFLLPLDTPFIAAQDSPATHEEMRRENSWIVVDGAGRHYRTDALATMFAHSRLPWMARLLRVASIQRIGDVFYQRVERTRPMLSRWMTPIRYRPLSLRHSKLTQIFVVLMIVFVTWENLWTWNERFRIPESLQWPATLLRVDQRWDMFSPMPARYDGWFVVPGQLANGKYVDIFRNGEEVSFARRPASEVAAQYKNERWRKFLMDISRNNDQRYLSFYADYLCRDWNRGKKSSDPDFLRSLEIIFVGHKTAPPGATPMPYEPSTLTGLRCAGW
jgi:predicted DCC family thiol-disulfide oxidoreductase YuxK